MSWSRASRTGLAALSVVVLAGAGCETVEEVVGGVLLAERRPEVRRISVEVLAGAEGVDVRAERPIQRIECNEQAACRGIPGEQVWNAECTRGDGCERRVAYGDRTALASAVPARPLRPGACYICWVWGAPPEFGTVQFCVAADGKPAPCPSGS
jgi:hypothetical protein